MFLFGEGRRGRDEYFNKIISITNISTGTTTITTPTGVILARGLSVASITLAQSESIQLVNDGTNWIQLSMMTGVGYGQTWQAPVRAIGTTYTNSTGKTIIVAITATNVNASVEFV